MEDCHRLGRERSLEPAQAACVLPFETRAAAWLPCTCQVSCAALDLLMSALCSSSTSAAGLAEMHGVCMFCSGLLVFLT